MGWAAEVAENLTRAPLHGLRSGKPDPFVRVGVERCGDPFTGTAAYFFEDSDQLKFDSSIMNSV